MCEEWFQNDEFIISEIHRYKAYCTLSLSNGRCQIYFWQFYFQFSFWQRLLKYTFININRVALNMLKHDRESMLIIASDSFPPPCCLWYIYIYMYIYQPDLFVIPIFNQADRFRSPLVSAYGSYFRVKDDRFSGGKKNKKFQHQLI